ncbi:MAG TPA: hypothetical protein DDW98_08895 [Gammaproteobacteria bacterium]|nr:hypothetical protein [Gammaproteobacteria bacterium]
MARALREAPNGPLNPYKVEKLCGFKRSTMSLILNGTTKTIQLKNARLLEEVLNVRGEWLADGTEPMRPGAPMPQQTKDQPKQAASHMGWVLTDWAGTRKLTDAQKRVWKAVLLYLELVPDGACAGLESLITYLGLDDEPTDAQKRLRAAFNQALR